MTGGKRGSRADSQMKCESFLFALGQRLIDFKHKLPLPTQGGLRSGATRSHAPTGFLTFPGR